MRQSNDPNPSIINETLKEQNASEHLANERTFLAWIRTSIGIMAFGFVVVKFSFFIKQLAYLLEKDKTIPAYGNSSVIGILLVAVGTVVLLFSFIRYKKTEKELTNKCYQSSPLLILLITIIIVIISILLIVYLVMNTKLL